MLEFENRSIETALEEEGEVMSSIAGISMFPMLRNRRDMVVIKKVEGRLKKHDVPLYRLPSGKLVLHRILKVTDKGYVIRGDNLMNKEYNITDDNIIGVLKAFYRNGKCYDCATSKAYKVYIFFNRVSFPIRFVWRTCVRLPLGRLKRFILKNKS